MLSEALGSYVAGQTHTARRVPASCVVQSLQWYEAAQDGAVSYQKDTLVSTVQAVLQSDQLPSSVQTTYLYLASMAPLPDISKVAMQDACEVIRAFLVHTLRPRCQADAALGPWIVRLMDTWDHMTARFHTILDMLRPVGVSDVVFLSICTAMLQRTCRDTHDAAVWDRGVYAVAEAVRRGQYEPSTLQRVGHLAGVLKRSTHALVEQAHAYYDARVKELLGGSFAEAVPHIHAWIVKEHEWAGLLGEAAVPDVVATQVVLPHQQALADTLSYFLDRQDTQRLQSCYAIFDDAGILPVLYATMRKHVESRVKDMMQSTDDSVLIEKLCQQHHLWHGLWKSGLHADPMMRDALHDGFEHGMSVRGTHMAQLLAQFAGAQLGRGMDTWIDDMLLIFRCLYEKDVFEVSYRHAFAQRLLQQCSHEAELVMLERLRQECGPDYTRQLETMHQDMDASNELLQEFDSASTPFEFDARVLTQSHWPAYEEIPLRLPAAMASVLQRFEAFYASKYQARSLHWCHALGSVVMQADLGRAGTKELVVNTLQAVVLLAFSTTHVLSYTDLATRTGLPPAALDATLQSLTCGAPSTRVLCKSPAGRAVQEHDTFRVNEDLVHTARRICIPPTERPTTHTQQHAPSSDVLVDRDMFLQAAVMRVLKRRSLLSHSDLLKEVSDQCRGRFALDPAELKHALERLMEKDCVERAGEERHMYRYVP